MKSSIKNKYRQIYRNILKILPTKVVLNIENLRGYHKLINFKNPKHFGEKIQALKVYGNLEQYTNLVDKYKVRDYIEKKIGKEYLIPLLGVYNNAEEIDYSKLPNQFVLKINNGSGYNIIVKDKKTLNIKDTNKTLNKWLKEDYSKIKKEVQYKNVERKIICEQFINDKKGQLLDYKFYCFNNNIEFIEVDFDRFENHTMNFYDTNWNLLDITKGDYQTYKGECNKPMYFDKMVELVNVLCKEFQFARIDFYNVDGKIYFGELTFTPASGLTPFNPIEKDIELAKKIEIKGGNE